MDDTPEDSIARPEPCGHPFCRDCLRGHVSARLEEHRFPILCPTCTASTGKGKGVTGGTCQTPVVFKTHVTSLRGFTAYCPESRTHRSAVHHMD
jgi:hypothetical protein